MWQRPSIVSVAMMVAGGNDGLPWWRGGGHNGFSQVYNRGWHDISQPHSGLCEVLAFTDAMGEKNMLILLTLQHHPLRALCHSIKNIYQFPCEENVIACSRGGC